MANTEKRTVFEKRIPRAFRTYESCMGKRWLKAMRSVQEEPA